MVEIVQPSIIQICHNVILWLAECVVSWYYHQSGFAKSSLFDFLTGTSFLSCYIWAIRSVIIYTRPTLHFFDKRKRTTADCRSWSMILTLALQRMSQNVTPRQGLENVSRLVTLLRARCGTHAVHLWIFQNVAYSIWYCSWIYCNIMGHLCWLNVLQPSKFCKVKHFATTIQSLVPSTHSFRSQ